MINNPTYCDESEYKTRKAVNTEYPDATRIVKVCGGWAVFATESDYQTWRHNGGAAERKGRPAN